MEENPNLMDPDQLSALSTNLTKIFSLTRTGLWVNTMALQKLSTLENENDYCEPEYLSEGLCAGEGKVNYFCFR